MAKTTKDEFGLDIEEMAKAGLHFGHRTSKLHPKMEPYLYGVRSTVHLIDLEKTLEKMREVLEFLKEISGKEKILLLVGTKLPHRKLVKNIAQECGLPYVTERWLGGTLTNFSVMKKRIEYLKELEKKIASPDIEKYTKKERADINKEIEDLKTKFEGLREFQTLPDVVFVCDMIKDGLAIKEARRKQIPVIGICDTNADPSLADYSIPANDDAISSVRYILEKVKETILKSKPKKQGDKKSEDTYG